MRAAPRGVGSAKHKAAQTALNRTYSALVRKQPIRKRKYANEPTAGYASKKEAKRAAELRLLEKAGEIRDLKLQVKFELIPEQKLFGAVVEKPCTYIADSTYVERRGSEWVFIVEDVKSEATRTEAYRVKRKLMLFVFGIRVRET